MNEQKNEKENEQKISQTETAAANELLSNIADIKAEKSTENLAESDAEKKETATENTQTETSEDETKTFRKFKIKDIVFLAIMAACMLVTGSIMPLVGSIPVFGIVQVCLGLQFSIFPTIGMMKVRKPGALLFMSLCCGVVFAFMFLPMFVCIMICAIVAEGLTLLIFRGYKKDGACLFAGAVYFPLTLPTMWLYYKVIYTTGENAAFSVANAWVAIGMSAAVVAICILGAVIGTLISKELKKAGALKK